MSFENIDTPASEAELSGMEVAETVETPVDPVETDPLEKTPAPKAEAEEQEDQTPERAPVIPRARFDEVNAKLHTERERAEAAERRLAELEQSQQSATTASGAVDIDALEAQFFDAMIEGDKESAIKIRAQINSEIYLRAEATATDKVESKISDRETKSALNEVGAKVIEQYPFLNHQSESANPEAINDVVEWRDFYASKGDPIHVALEKAAAKVGPIYADKTTASPPAVDSRKQDALKRNAVDANAQPPSQVAGIGNRAAPPGPKVETQQDWEKLSEADRESILQ